MSKMIELIKKRVYDKGVLKVLSEMAIFILKICLFPVSFYLLYIGIRASYYSARDYNQYIYAVQDSIAVHIGVFIFLGMSVFVLQWIKGYVKDKIPKESFWSHQENFCKIVLILSCFLLVIAEYFYVREHPYYPSGDQLNTTAGSVYAREGNYLMFTKGGYIGLYEQQKGLLFLYEILFSIFGDFRYDITSKFHICLSVITLLSGYSFLKIVMKRPVYRILYCGMMVCCLPCIIYLPYAYGDLPAICFSMVLFWALAAYGEQMKKRYLICACLMAAFALLMRMHIWVVLIAAGIGLLLLSLEKKTFRPILAALCVVLVAQGAVKGVDKMYEYRSGYESGVGIPYILWIAMGLQETDGNPGIYNRYQQSVFGDCDFNQEAAEKIGKEYIAARLEELKENPAYARYFFTTKIKMQWTEPLFQGLYETHSFKEDTVIPKFYESLYYGEIHDTVWMFANYYQSVVYISLFVFVSMSFKKSKTVGIVGWIPLIAVLGGFLFSIIWENKCRYVMPYYVYIILYAPVGIVFIADCMRKLIRIGMKRMKVI